MGTCSYGVLDGDVNEGWEQPWMQQPSDNGVQDLTQKKQGNVTSSSIYLNVSHVRALEGKWAQESFLTFKHHYFQTGASQRVRNQAKVPGDLYG